MIIVMIRWTGLAPWEFEFPFLRRTTRWRRRARWRRSSTQPPSSTPSPRPATPRRCSRAAALRRSPLPRRPEPYPRPCLSPPRPGMYPRCPLRGPRPGQALPPSANSSTVIGVRAARAYWSKHWSSDAAPCEDRLEDRLGTGPPRARTQVIYVDLGYWVISGSTQPKGGPASWGINSSVFH